MAVLTPITWPSRLTSGPPELPGLIEASVWITVWVSRRRAGPGARGADDPGRDRAVQAEGRADRDHRLRRCAPGRAPERGRDQVLGVRAQDRDVVGGVGAHDPAVIWRPPWSCSTTWSSPETTCSLVITCPARSKTKPEPLPRRCAPAPRSAAPPARPTPPCRWARRPAGRLGLRDRRALVRAEPVGAADAGEATDQHSHEEHATHPGGAGAVARRAVGAGGGARRRLERFRRGRVERRRAVLGLGVGRAAAAAGGRSRARPGRRDRAIVAVSSSRSSLTAGGSVVQGRRENQRRDRAAASRPRSRATALTYGVTSRGSIRQPIEDWMSS